MQVQLSNPNMIEQYEKLFESKANSAILEQSTKLVIKFSNPSISKKERQELLEKFSLLPPEQREAALVQAVVYLQKATQEMKQDAQGILNKVAALENIQLEQPVVEITRPESNPQADVKNLKEFIEFIERADSCIGIFGYNEHLNMNNKTISRLEIALYNMNEAKKLLNNLTNKSKITEITNHLDKEIACLEEALKTTISPKDYVSQIELFAEKVKKLVREIIKQLEG